MPVFQMRVWRRGFWVRVFGWGVVVRRGGFSDLLFSEREGYTPVFCRGGWIIKPLRRDPE